VQAYNQHVAKTRTLKEKWDVESAAHEKMLCYCNVWLSEKDEKDNRSALDASQFNVCADLTYTPRSMDYGMAAAKAACPLTSVASYPGTSGFITQEYSGFLDFVEQVIPCTVASAMEAPTTKAPTTEAPPCSGVCFSTGDRVQIKPDSVYAYESSDCGTPDQDICPGAGYKSLTFDDGNSFWYPHEVLECCTVAPPESATTTEACSGDCFSIGNRVRIKPDSEYAYESSECGTPDQSICPGSGYGQVTLDDGNTFGYPHHALECCP